MAGRPICEVHNRPKQRWIVVSMKDDWERIFAFE
jgi:hypothetical protein